MLKKVVKKFFYRIYMSGRNSYIEKNKGKDKEYQGTIIAGNEKLLFVGVNVSFGGNVILYLNAPIFIGDHTMIAVNVVLHTSTHNYNNHPMRMERIDRPIKIGKHVWVGIGAIICPGVIIEDYAVIGAGSVVVSNVPSKAIVAGNPAKIIKYREMNNVILDKEVKDYLTDALIIKNGYLDSKNICKKK